MKSNWQGAEAQSFVDRYAALGVDQDLALRVYTTRLLGADPRLVLHGGGNSSVKTRMHDIVGDEWRVLCVKGSGWDMASIEPQGLPAVKLEPLLKARRLERLSDEDMVALQRANLLDPAAPNPSVETLLHAYLPHKFVDHTHSTAVLSISNQPDGEARCADLYAGKLAVVPYVMPGFELASLAARTYEEYPDVEGLILHKHGIFTFGESARESYERMIEYVSMAEEYLSKPPAKRFTPVTLPDRPPSVADVAAVLRGACRHVDRNGATRRVVVEYRTSNAIRNYVDGKHAADYATRGVTTPDLVIRVKREPLILPPPTAGALEDFKQTTRTAVDRYVGRYREYFERNNVRSGGEKTMVDPLPRLILVPGMGLFALAGDKRSAVIAADVGENIVATVTDAEAIGRFEPLPEAELFEMEYWSLEQAKLGKTRPAPLAGQVAVITGGAGAIGAATARLFAQNGALVAVLDKDAAAAQALAEQIGDAALGIECNVTEEAHIANAFDQVGREFGGVDILVSNAGAAWQGEVGALADADLRASFELNFFAHQAMAQQAVRVMLLQGTGGALLFNASKQAVNPGKNFAAYGLPKAATLLLSRQYALEYGQYGIRSNAVNADRIRSGLLTGDMISRRAEARGVSERDYMEGNLLGREVTAEHVAQAFLTQALAERTTADVMTVDGGNIAAALR